MFLLLLRIFSSFLNKLHILDILHILVILNVADFLISQFLYRIPRIYVCDGYL
jgi:hypothetical protein